MLRLGHIYLLIFIFIVLTFLLLIVSKISFSSFEGQDYQTKIKFFKPVITQLLKKGADSNFIFSLLADNKTQFNEKYVKINVTGYLRKNSNQEKFDWKSVYKSRLFINEHNTILQDCFLKYGVPPEIVASIMWIETKQGDFLGSNHLPSVLLSTAMAGQPVFINMNIMNAISELKSDITESDSIERKLIQRSVQKSEWATNELLALNKIQKEHSIDVNNLFGSWAGAFGIPQFMPSSYMKWAVDGNEDKITNLFDFDDAILSIGNYLKNHGWSENSDSQRKAVFLYNNSSDYVNKVFKLASRIKPAANDSI